MLVLLIGLPTCGGGKENEIIKNKHLTSNSWPVGQPWDWQHPFFFWMFDSDLQCWKSCFYLELRNERTLPLCPQTRAWLAPIHTHGPAAGVTSAHECACRGPDREGSGIQNTDLLYGIKLWVQNNIYYSIIYTRMSFIIKFHRPKGQSSILVYINNNIV